MKRKITVILALLLAFSLCSCNKSQNGEEQATTTGDWRNTIEYEGSFFVDSKTKLLYALDKGTITLWNNSGDGSVLQVLDYNSAESAAIESLEIKDVNGDGANDISTIFSENEEGKKYNLWLWDSANGKYKDLNGYRKINDPVVSEDFSTITGTLDRGIFGIVESIYTFTEELSLEEISVCVSNADEVAKGITTALNLPEAKQAEGEAFIQSTKCSVYTADNKAYIAHTPNGYWYVDIGCVGAYKAISDNNGAFEAGVYVDEAGEITDVCATIYECNIEELTISETSIGNILPCSYDEDGNVLPSNDLAIDASHGEVAKGFTIERNGETLCRMLKSDNSTYYCLDPDLSGDNYYYVVSLNGESKLVEKTASNFYLK